MAATASRQPKWRSNTRGFWDRPRPVMALETRGRDSRSRVRAVSGPGETARGTHHIERSPAAAREANHPAKRDVNVRHSDEPPLPKREAGALWFDARRIVERRCGCLGLPEVIRTIGRQFVGFGGHQRSAGRSAESCWTLAGTLLFPRARPASLPPRTPRRATEQPQFSLRIRP